MLPTLWTRLRRMAKQRRRAKPLAMVIERLEERLLLANWSGDIPNGTVWTNTEVQRITGDVHVPAGATLTIQAGTVVKFNSYFMNFTVDGTLLAQGTSGSPIVITELRDDTAGGDTNGDGGGSLPSNGNWGRIEFKAGSTGSVLDYVNLRYGGYNALGQLFVNGGQLTLSNSTARNSSAAGVRVQASNPTLTNNTYQNNSGAAVSMDLASNPTISGVTVTTNGVNGLVLDTGTLGGNGAWNDPDIVYWMSNDITVPQGSTLTIAAGQVIKRPYFGDLFVNGSLVATGTGPAPIIFTEQRDDMAGGDTNNAGGAPDNGNAGVILFSNTSTGNVMDHVEVRYGGYGYAAAVIDDGGPLSFTNGVIRNSGTYGLRIQASNPTVTGNTFQSNSYGAISMDLASNPAVSGNTLTTNGVNGLVLDTGSLVGNRAWNDPDIVYWMSNDITVPQGSTLTIAAGQVIKRPYYGDLFVNGSLVANGTAVAPIIFTEQRDDAAGGDTNNGAGNPDNGNAGVIQFSNTSTGNVMDHVEVRYAGYGYVAAVIVDGGPLSFTNGVIRNSGTYGLRIQASNPTVTDNTFQSNTYGAISMDLASNPAVSGNTLTTNGVNGLVLDTGTLVGNRAWNDPDIVYWMSNDITVPQGSTLTIAAGQVIKRPYFGDLFVNGSLVATGTGPAPIIFTEQRDDAAGGDTNNGAGSPGNGNAGVIQFSNTSTGNVMDHVEVRYGGYGYVAAVIDDGGPLSFTNGVIRNSGTYGLRIQASNPTVTDNTFQSNTYGAISMDLASNPAVSGNTLTTNGVNGLVLDSGNLVGNGLWNDPDIVYWLTNDVTVPQGATLTIAPGQVIKRPYFGDLFVNGSLVATSVASAPIIITEQRDDTAGGDTNNDAAASGPGNGNAGVIQFSNSSTGNVMDHVEVRYSGYGYAAAVIDDGGSLAFTNGVVRNSATNALLAKTSATLNVQNSLIVNNSDTGIRAESGATVTAFNNTIDGNYRGVAVDSRITVVTLTNNLITNNSRSGITATNQGSIVVSFNDVLNPGAVDGNYNGLPNATGLNGNISVDPKFVDRAIRDFHLQATSPAIDAATSDNAPIDDFDFNFRTDNPSTTNTGAGLSPFFDMGAYEFGGRPRAVKHSPNGDVADVVSKITFTFRTAMDSTSFSPAADVVSFTGPAGPIAVTGFQWINRYQLEVTFNPQATAGNYQLVMGPNILDANGNALDTDGDGVRGESPDDRYSANWRIVPPRIVRQSLPNFVPAPVDHVDFTFDRPMDQQSFAPADDIVSFKGPGGNISATGFSWTDSRTLQISFGSQTVLGPYELVIGPNIRDVGGNLLDQSRNGVGGEVPVDRYTATFTLANIFFVSGNITQNTTWGGLIIVDGNVTVQSGATLTINPGTVIKFRDNLALTVATGATLAAIGTVAQPIRITSIHDDTIGGDSEQDGDRIAPQPGDWSQIVNQGTANFDHVQILFSSGVGNTGLNSGAIRNSGGTVTFSNSAIIDAFYDGLDSVNGTVTITNSIISGTDRGVVSTFSADNITIINSTIFDNRLGVLAHAGGHITMKNSIIAESLQVGFDTDSGAQTVRYTDIFSSVAGAISYRGMTSQTGVNGNVSVNPKFIDAVQHNYRLDFASPVIDAAEGSVAPTTDHVGSPRYDDPRTANTGTPTANSTYADMGAFEFVEGAPSDLDLIVIGVSGPTAAVTGDIVTVQWTTKNVGTGIATGDWQDAVYLSADTVWSPDDVLLSQALHAGNLGPGQSYANSAEVKIPGILPSRYYFLVRANSDNAVFEGRNLTNNVAVASSGVTIDVAVLGIGTPVQGTLAGTGDARVYKLVVPPGSNLKILLDGPNGAANELYVQRGAVPTRQSFDLRGILLNQPDQSVSLGTITGGTYYVLVFAASTPTSETFTLTASPTGFAIDSISPTRGGNTGRMTISIAGSQFDANSQPRLIDSASQTINPISVAFINSTLISATFDLTGRATGPATVEVVNTGNFIASLPGVLNIVAGGQGRLVTTISAPDRVRLGRDFVAYVTYTNTGDTDLIAPIFRVINSGSSTLSLTKDRTVTSTVIELIGVNPNGAPAGILPPGATGRIPIYGRATTTADQNLRVETAQFPSTPIDYVAIESAMRPAGLTNAQWVPLFNQLKTQVGTTWSGYVAALSRDATLLTPAQGLNYSVADVFQIEVDKARAALNSSVSGRLFLNDTTHPLSGPTILLVEQTTNRTFTTPASSDGTFLFSRIDQPGTYDVKVEGYILLSPVSVTAGTSDVTGVNLLVTPAATISGRVLLAVGGAPVPDAAVMAYLAGGTSFVATTQGDGTYTIPNVPAGTYTVQAGESSYVKTMVSNILVGAGARVQNVNLAVEVAGKISGKVNGPSGVLAGATVSVYGADGVPIGSGSVSTATGDYTIGGLPAGQYTVQASANGFAPAYLPNVSINAGVTLTNQNLTLSAGGSASGIVNSLASGTAVVAAVIVASKAGVDLAVTNSDTDGSFSLPNLAPGSYTFTAFLPGFASATVNASVTANQTTNLGTISMATSASVSGTVVRTSNSAAVGGLRVTAWTGGLAVGEAVTASNGGFAMSDLAFGTYLVTVGGEGQGIIASSSAILSSGTPAATLNFSLPIIGSITGTVFESNGVTPVTSAAVTLVSGATPLTSTITGADGRYQFYLTAPGTYGVQAVATGAAFGPQSNLVISSGTDLTAINLVAGTAVVQGTIRNAATGQPVADAFLHISGTGINGIRTIVADTNGQYRFAGAPGSQLQLVAHAGTLSYSIANHTLSAGGSTQDFSLVAGAALNGVVIDAATSLPVFGATVFVRNQSGLQGGFITYSDEQGGYSIIGLQTGTYDVTVLDSDHQSLLLVGLAVSGAQTIQNFSLAAKNIVVGGTVRDTAGRVLPGAVVRAVDAQGNAVAFADSGNDGTYSLTTVPPGTFTLTASANGGVDVSLSPVTVAAGNNVSGKDFTLNPIAIRREIDQGVSPAFSPARAFQPPVSAADRSFTDRLFHRNPPTRLPDEATLPNLPSGSNCVSVIVSHRELAGRIHARETLFDAWRENYEAGKDIKAANAGLIVAQGLKFAGDIAKIYLSFQKVFFEVTQAGRLAIGPGQVFLQDFLFPRISQLNTLLITGKKLVEKATKSLGEGKPSLPDAGTLLDTVKFGRQLTSDLLKALVDKKNLKLFGQLSDRLGLITDLLSAAKDAWELGTFVADAMNDSDTIAGNTDLAKDLYIRASADAIYAAGNYEWQLKNCDDHDPHVNSPAEVPLPGWAGGPGAGGSSTTVSVPTAVDPNDKHGPGGFGTAAFIQPGLMPFKIEFENDPNLGATIPAQEVFVTDTLDADLDPTTVEFTGFQFNNLAFSIPPGLAHYETTIDLRPNGINLLVPVAFDVNPQTRRLSAVFRSLDPLTGLPPDDVDSGFLPVNNKSLHNGEGFFTYTVEPVAGRPSGTEITNQGSIVFDVNAPILTPTTRNTLDVGTPISGVAALPTTSAGEQVIVSWSGSDEAGGSGVASYDVFVSDNGGAFQQFVTGTTATSATFAGTIGHTYAFYSVSSDNVGHREAAPLSPDASTTLVPNTAPVLNNTGAPYVVAPAGTRLPTDMSYGILVTDLLSRGAGGNPITDADAGALEGIALTGINKIAGTFGTWEFTLDANPLTATWTNVETAGALSDSSALLLPADANTRLRFVTTLIPYHGSSPAAGHLPTETKLDTGLTFRAWDRTTGAAGTRANTTANGGTTAFSSVTETAATYFEARLWRTFNTAAQLNTYTLELEATILIASFGYQDRSTSAYSGFTILMSAIPGVPTAPLYRMYFGIAFDSPPPSTTFIRTRTWGIGT